MALRDAMKAVKRPPNLRSGNARKRCGLCTHFRGTHRTGTCQLYRFGVQASQVSDSFTAKEA